MTFEEAIQHSLNVPWKVSSCFVGDDCWCRMIVPVDPIKFSQTLGDGTIKEDVLDEIIGAGTIGEETAEYIVRIHNAKVARLDSLNKLSELDQDLGWL